MSKCLFLQGDVQIGKSTLLLECLQPYLPYIGGFVVQRLLQGEHLKAFCLKEITDDAWSVNASYQGDEANIFICEQKGQWLSDEQVFEQIGENLVCEATRKKILVLDEIGGVELLSDSFRQNLYKALSGEVFCVGVLKSAANSKLLRENVVLSQRYQELYQQLFADIRERFDGEVFDVTEKNKLIVKSKIQDFLMETGLIASTKNR